MGKASEAILEFKPVSFRYKKEIDPHGIPEFGLIAEEVEKVNPDLIIRDREGKPQTVRYEQVNAMLLNEFLKEHAKVQELTAKAANQEAINAELRSTIGRQETRMEALAAQVEQAQAKIQKVNAQLAAASPSRGGLEMSKGMSKLVANKP
jgi:uncharacterized coiled-coil protein SlyX